MSARPRDVIPIVNVAGSVALALCLVAVFVLYASELALAQAADSISDVLTGTLLAWAARTAAQPADEEHPYGHASAEPVAALVVAVLAGVLATEVGRAAIGALLGAEQIVLAWPLAAVFAAKVAFKLGIAKVASDQNRLRSSPVLEAMRVDARNDAVVGSVALIGFGMARAGLPHVDPILATAVAIYVAGSSLRLARESVMMLLGTSAPPERLAALRANVLATAGVIGVEKMVAVVRGTALHVEIDLLVDAELTLRAAHDVAHAVEERLRHEEDVSHVVVHVSPRE